MLTPLKESYDQPRQHIKKQRHYLANKGQSSQSYGFSNSHVWMWESDYKENWAPKNWCLWTVMLEKTLESPLDCKKIQPVHPKGNQSWLFTERQMLKLKLQYFGLIHSLEKPLMLGKIKGRRRRGRQRMRWLDGIADRWTWVWSSSGSGDGQESLACCSPWGHKELAMTEQLTWPELNLLYSKSTALNVVV